MSETAMCRSRLAKWCQGCGLDLGFGGDPIVPTAICVDLPIPYTKVGGALAHLAGDARSLYWFQDGVFDYVYSSHLLEDFVDTNLVLTEWLRVLKPDGRLILYCPDEQRFKAHCKRTGRRYNEAHKHAHFSLQFVREELLKIQPMNFLVESPSVEDYSWELVCERLR